MPLWRSSIHNFYVVYLYSNMILFILVIILAALYIHSIMTDKQITNTRENFTIKRCDDHMYNYLDKDQMTDDILTNDKVTKKYIKNKKRCVKTTYTSQKPDFSKFTKEKKIPCDTFDPNPVRIDDFINYYNDYVVSEDLTLTDPPTDNCVINPKPDYSGMPLDYDDPVSRINYVREEK